MLDCQDLQQLRQRQIGLLRYDLIRGLGIVKNNPAVGA